MSKITNIMVHFDGTVTLWLEGKDSMTDYFPAVHSVRQKHATEYIKDYGLVDGAYIQGTNHRDAGEEWPKDHKSAFRLAKKWGVIFKDKVAFPNRITKAEAVIDAGLEDFETEVVFKNFRGYVHKEDKVVDSYYTCEVVKE